MKKLSLVLLGVLTLTLAACNSSPTPVAKKDFEGVSFVDEKVTYDGAEHTIVAKGIPDGAKATYKDNGPFVDVGSYPMSVTVAKDGYNDWKGSATLDIEKATMTNVVFEDDVIEYDGKGHTLVATGYPIGSNVTYTPSTQFTEPGSYDITVKVTNKNYVDFEDTATLTILPRTMTGITFEDKEVEYDGAEHTITAVGYPAGAVVTYDPSTGFTDVGTYDISVTIEANGYVDYEETATLTIKKATMNVSFNDSELTYDGLEHSIEATGYPEGSVVTYTPAEPVYTLPGEYPISVKITNPNYEDFEKSVTLTINPKSMPTITFDDTEVTYDGESHTIVATGYPEGATVTYNPSTPFVNAGEYDISVTVSMTGYTDFNKTAKLTINKAVMSPTFADQTIAYDGQSHTITATNVPDGSTEEYKNAGPHTNGGLYKIDVKITNPNYETYEGSANLLINQHPDKAFVIEDVEGKTDNDLVDEWGKIQFWGDSGWKDSSSAAMNVAEEQIPGNTTSKQVIRVKTTHQGSAFKLTKEISKAKKGILYDAFAIDVRRGTSNAQEVKLQYWLEDLPLPEEYKGYKTSYVTYKLSSNISDNWMHYEIPLDDAGWSFNGLTQVTMAQALQMMGLTAAELAQYMTSACILINGAYVSGGPTAYTYFDNFGLVPSCSAKQETALINKVGLYTGKNAADNHLVVHLKTDKVAFRTMNVKDEFIANFDVTYSGSVATMVYKNGSESLKVMYDIAANGEKLNFSKVEATTAFESYAPLFKDLNLKKVFTVDDFESFSETGVGYDKNNTEDKKSGLRGAYFSDYYSGNGSTSRMGGNGWDLMGSTDYLYLETSKIHSGKNSGNFKLSTNQMRYTTFGLSDGSAKRIGSGNKLSFWINPSVATTLKVRAYYYPHVTPSDQTSGDMSETTFTLTAGSWNEYIMDIKADKDLYGISLIPGKVAGRLYIDDIKLFTDVNPNEVYVEPSISLPEGDYYYWSGASNYSMTFHCKGGDVGYLKTMNSGSVQIAFDLTYPDAGQMVMKDSDTKGQSLSINATMSDGNFQITSVTGAYASLYSSILLNKTFKPYAGVNRDFEEGTADKTAVTKEWTCKKYSSGSWVDVAAPSMYYKAANGGKVANCYAGKKTDYIYYYTPDKMIGPVNHFEIDLAAYWKANDTINVKISLIDGSGNATYVVGNGDTAEQITQATATKTDFKSYSVNLSGIKIIKQIKIYVKNALNDDNYLYFDNVYAGLIL